MHGNLRVMLGRLIPDEPFFPYGDRRDVQYPEELPISIKYWSFLSIIVNLMLIAVGTIVDYNPSATILFGVFVLAGPIWALIGWERFIRKFNRRIDDIEKGPLQFVIQLPFPSCQWLALLSLVGITLCMAFIVIVSTIVEFRFG